MALFKRKETEHTPKIHMAGVSKTFGKKRVLHKMDLDVYPGESLVIIGGSGTGKSVTLKCILGLLTPDSGKIEVEEKISCPFRKKNMNALWSNLVCFSKMQLCLTV